MTPSASRPSFLTYVLLFLCVLMTGSNIYLLHANRAFKQAKARSGMEVPIGQVVDVIAGTDFDSNPFQIKTGGKKATVLMIYSPTCRFCERNWPGWSRLIGETPDPNVDFEVVDITSVATPAFLATKGLGRANLVHQLDAKEANYLNLNFTPQTILIGGDSKVKKVWSGVLSSKDLSDVGRFLN